MIYRLQDGKILPHGEAPLAPDGRYIGLGSLEASSPLFPCSLPSDLFEKSLANPATRFEGKQVAVNKATESATARQPDGLLTISTVELWSESANSATSAEMRF